MFPIYWTAIVLSLLDTLLLLQTEPVYADKPRKILLSILVMILFFAAVISIFATILTSVVYSIIRFKKSLLGSEGYLMNTLPVSAFANVASKMLCTFVYLALSVITVLICIAIFGVLLAIDSISEPASIFEKIGYVLSQIDIYSFTFAALIVLMMMFIAVKFSAMICTSMAIGHSFSSEKSLASVGIFILASAVEAMIMRLPLFTAITDAFNADSLISAVYFMIAVIIIVCLVYTIIYTVISSVFIKKHLNLE